MESLKPYKSILIWGGVLLIVFGGYMYWRNRSSPEGSALVSSDALQTAGFSDLSQVGVAGQQIISILNELRQIRIKKDVFENPVFKSLVDYTIATTSEEKGRPDPFEPLPFELEAKAAKK